MKTSKKLVQAVIRKIEHAQKLVSAPKAVKYFLFLIMVSSMSFFSSCAVEVRTPQPGITIETNQHGFRYRQSMRHNNRQHHYDDHDRR